MTTATITSLSRKDRGKIVTAYDKAQTHFDRVHGAMLAACKKGVRGESANRLLRELDMAADFMQRHRREVGRLLDELTEDS